MAQTINKGRRLHVFNITLSTEPTTVTLNQKVNGFIIQCRTAVDILFYESDGDENYFTIKSGTVLPIDYKTRNNQPFALASASGTPVAEIIGLQE